MWITLLIFKLDFLRNKDAEKQILFYIIDLFFRIKSFLPLLYIR